MEKQLVEQQADGNQAEEQQTDGAPVEETQEQTPTQPDLLSVRQVADILGVSARSVYSYIQTGRLAGASLGKRIVVRAEAVETFARRAPGRLRTSTPRWHQAPPQNRHFFTTITLRQRPGQEAQLSSLLAKMRRENAHCLPGTAARYILRTQNDPQEITLVLMWRGATMPSAEERTAAFVALRADLARVFDWETAVVKEGPALLHA